MNRHQRRSDTARDCKRPDRADPCRSAAAGTDLAVCLRHLGHLNGWEQQFVQAVATVLRRTPGQSRKLAEIANALRKNGAVRKNGAG